MKKIIGGILLVMLLVLVACEVASEESEAVKEVPTESVE